MTPFQYHRYYKFVLFTSVILTLLIHNSHSQINFDPQINPQNNFSNNFHKQNETWNWNGNLRSFENGSSFLNWNIQDRYNSSLINPGNSLKQWKDEHDFNGFFYKTYNSVTYGLYARSWILLDKQQVEKNEFSNHSGGGFSIINIGSNLSFKPYLGYQRAKNIAKTDWGWDSGIKAALNNQKIGDYNTKFEGAADYDFFETRKNFSNTISSSVATNFTTHSWDSLKIGYEESGKQYYTASGEDLVEVKLFDRQISNILFYQLAPDKLLKIESGITSKDINFSKSIENSTNRDRGVFIIGSIFTYRFIADSYNYEIEFKTSDENQENTEVKTNSRARISALGLKSIYYLGSNDNIDFNISYSKLQYDTPEENFDDRDEQRLVIDFDYFHRYSPVLSMNISAYGFLLHQIYLFSEQSINNNWNRVIKFAPEVRYKNGDVANTLTTTVLANYTDYDFDNLNLNKRSFLARRYTVQDSLNISLYKYVSLGVNGRVQFEEKGTFFAKQFAQNVVQTYRSERINTFVTKTLLRRFILKAGYTIYKRLEWRHLPKKKKYREIVNQGPFFNFQYEATNRISLLANISVNYIDDDRNKSRIYNNSYIKLLYSL